MEIKAQPRTVVGKKVKILRQAGGIPAIIFGKTTASTPIVVEEKPFLKAYASAGEATLVDLVVGENKPRKVLISEVQRDPVSEQIIHVNFHEISLTEKITTAVPVRIVGESQLVKSGGAILLTLLDELEVSCFPTDLPPEIPVDISNLNEVGQGVAVKDLKVDRSKVEIKAEPEEWVVKLDYPQMAEEKVEEEVSEAEAVEKVEATAEKKLEEEEAAAAEAGGKEKAEKESPAEKDKSTKEETPKKK